MVLLISYFILWILVILLSFSILTLLNRKPIRPVLPLQDRGLGQGSIFPKLQLRTISGEEFNLTQSNKQGTIIVFVSVNCSGCVEVYPALSPFSTRYPDISLVLAISGDETAIRDKIEKNSINIPVIQPSDQELEIMGISLAPFAYLVSPKGIILAKGGVPAGMQHFELLLNTGIPPSKRQAAA